MFENVFKLLKIIIFCTFLTQGGVILKSLSRIEPDFWTPPPTNHKKMYTTLY